MVSRLFTFSFCQAFVETMPELGMPFLDCLMDSAHPSRFHSDFKSFLTLLLSFLFVHYFIHLSNMSRVTVLSDILLGFGDAAMKEMNPYPCGAHALVVGQNKQEINRLLQYVVCQGLSPFIRNTEASKINPCC